MAIGRLQRGMAWLLCTGLSLSACREDKPPEPAMALKALQRQPMLPTAPSVDVVEALLANALVSRTRAPLQVAVMTCFQHPSYSYLEVRDPSGIGWVVAPSLHVEAGVQVTLSEYVRMRNFRAADLDVEVGNVLFVAKVTGPSVRHADTGQEAAVDPALPAVMVTETEALLELPKIAKADYRIAELYGQSAELADRRVKIRGQVLRVAAQIRNRNWVFLRDGSGAEGTRLVAALIEEAADLGEILVVEGRVEVEHTFAVGDRHHLLLDDARVLARDLVDSPTQPPPTQANKANVPGR